MNIISNVHHKNVVISLHPNNDDDTQYQDDLHQLHGIAHSFKTFSKTAECIDYINTHYDILDEKIMIFVQISDSLAHDIPILHALPQINSIYICCDQKLKCEQWTKEWRKVKGIFNDLTFFHDQLKLDLNKTNNENNHQDVSFMYLILLNQLFIDIEPEDGERNIFITYCRKLYASNPIELSQIDEFEKDYRPDKAIQWFTSPLFLYSIFHWAQRTQDIDIFDKMKFFIRDLYRQLEQLYLDSLLDISSPIVVYRGQCMTSEYFQTKLKNNVAGLFSIDTFWSTHLDEQMARIFMESVDSDREFVLFKITIDTTLVNKNNYTAVFADIHQLSMISDEQEVLFSPGTVFRIKSIEKDRQSWKVNLIFTNDHDEHLCQIMDYVRKDIDGPTGRHRLANLLFKMGKFDIAKHIYETLLNNTSKDNKQQIAIIHYQLASIFKENNDLERALEYYQKTLDVFSNDFPRLASTLSEIGYIFHQQGDLHRSMEYHQRAFDIELHDPKVLALRHASFASVLYTQHNFDEALTNLEQALEYIPPTYPERARIFEKIASVYYALENYSTALLYYQTVVQIEQNSIWPSHPDNDPTRLNLAKTLDKLKCT